MSRVVQKRFLIDERGMEEMRRILRTQAEFAGLDVITFCFLKNHFHVLLHVDPEKAITDVTDAELVRRFRALYGSKRSPSLGADADTLEVVLERDDERSGRVRAQLKARMGDVSVFMRELKTRFTFWYNKHYHTVGTFWAERYRRVFLEPGSGALRTVAAYIDLNAVRAGLAESPQAYRYCGLGEVAIGQADARAAYRWLVRRKKRVADNGSGRTKTCSWITWRTWIAWWEPYRGPKPPSPCQSPRKIVTEIRTNSASDPSAGPPKRHPVLFR